jgi:amidase
MYEEARVTGAGELPDGPFKGVPFLLKDLLAEYAGVRTCEGSAFLLDRYVPDHDSELVTRYKRAGLIVVGKTNTPEFGLVPTTEPQLFGPSRNPWDTDRTTGGSSGGSAAAVATGIVPMAHGNDGGGSIRIPASCCGLFGLKPTRGRNPLGPDRGDIMGGLVVEHALTRSVRDSAALLDATSGPDIGDPYRAPHKERPFLQEVGADPGKLRVAFTTVAATGAEVHTDCVSAVNEAAQLCSELGHEVEEAAPEIDGAWVLPRFMTLYSAGCAAGIDYCAHHLNLAPTENKFEPLTWAMYELGRKRTASDYLLALSDLQKLSRDIARFFTKYDILITPTVAEPPVPLGTFDSPVDDAMRGMRRAGAFAPFTALFNITGQPAMSMPLFWNSEGLPIGTQFVGRFGDEAALFRLAAQLEKARPWADRRPPASA